MKYTQKITAGIISFGAIAALVAGFGALPAFAQTSSKVKTGATPASQVQEIITKSDSAISARIDALNALSARINGAQNISPAEKASLSSDITTNESGLTSLKATIDAGGTNLTSLRTESKSVFGNYRIYALVIPQGWITASSDRVQTIVGLMNTLSAKLQTRITAAGAAGTNVSAAQASMTDMNAKVADAQSQAQAAEAGVANLVPDKGNATIAASNKVQLVAARAKIKVATADLAAARKDVQSILGDLKIVTDSSATASATASAQ